MITPGLYRHFKGTEYRVVCVATHSETSERMVVYHRNELPATGEDAYWVRPEAMFEEHVMLNVLRFTRVGD